MGATVILIQKPYYLKVSTNLGFFKNCVCVPNIDITKLFVRKIVINKNDQIIVDRKNRIIKKEETVECQRSNVKRVRQ